MRYVLKTYDGACYIDGLALTLAEACGWANRARVRLPRIGSMVEVWRDPVASERVTYVACLSD